MNSTFFCNKCGAPNDAGAQFCGRCGAALNPGAAPSSIPATAIPAPGYAAAPASYAATAAYPSYAAGVHYGGFWIRVVAAIIDFCIIRVMLFPIKAMLGLGSLAANGFDFDRFHHGMALPLLLLGGGVYAVLSLIANWIYEALMESSSYQATLGKMIFGMKITDLAGNRIDFARATGRHFAKFVSGLLLGIGFIMVGFTERKQGLHDIMAGTLVRKS